MDEQRSYLHRRFGTTIARRYLRVWFAVVLTVFLGFLTVSVMLPFGAIRWIGAMACCAGLAILGGMYQTGVAHSASKNKPKNIH